MITIEAANVNDAFMLGVMKMRDGKQVKLQSSRNGPCLEFTDPVSTVYRNPLERVLFTPERDANPFLHLFDALYCLSGRNDVAWISQFAPKNLPTYSDDGLTFNGAYGFRWREHFGFDQLLEVVTLLQREPDTRRAVLQMWEPEDLRKSLPGGRMSKDVPCNTAVYFKIRNNQLIMTVVNRSNDMIWGAYGANMVQFSLLQEYVAAMVGGGVEVGAYHQVSDSLHAYVDVFEKVRGIPISFTDPYSLNEVHPYRLVNDPVLFNLELDRFMEDPVDSNRFHEYSNSFFRDVAHPMYQAWAAMKHKGDFSIARDILATVKATDWQRAALEYISRRNR